MAVKLLSTNNKNNSAVRSIAAALFTLFSILCILNGCTAFYNDINDDPGVNVYGENTRPIIGILTQEVSRFVKRTYAHENYQSYIAASYVKFVEGAGGRAVPIWIGQSREYYEDIMSKINGVLMPGGATYFNQSGGYADAGRYIYDIAVNMNERGIHMPIWGTCLGYELLVYVSSNVTESRTSCWSMGQAMPLEFEKGYKESRLFSPASDDILYFLSAYNVTANFHVFCYTKQTFALRGYDKIWKVMSVNHDWNGIEFISTIEHRKYPFYGVQFHPEKNLYEFVPNRNITHTTNAILVSQYFGNFFMNEARKNRQKFADPLEEIKALIYNYHPEYTGAKGSSFVQTYMFKAKNASATNKAADVKKLRSLLALIALFALVSVTTY